MPVQDLCFNAVVKVSTDVTLRDAAVSMRDKGVGAVVVVDGKNNVVGILTDRDLAVSAIAGNIPLTDPVSEIMSSQVVTVPRNAGIAEVIDIMESKQVRRVVVTDDMEHPCGLVSTDDLLQLLGDELQSLGNLVGRQTSRRARKKEGKAA